MRTITVTEGLNELKLYDSKIEKAIDNLKLIGAKKKSVDKVIKKIFKNNTEILIAKRLPYWAEITGLKYNEVKIRDAITRYGSCMPNKRNLYFSSRLIMLPMDKVDAIIVHELCHIKYKYHNNDFYNLAEKYISNYIEIDKWLKKNGDNILF